MNVRTISSSRLVDGEKLQNLPEDVNAALELKVDKVTGKELSSNDYTDAEKIKVGIVEVTTNKGANNGYAGLDATGVVPSSQLPSYVDDVLEFPTLGDFPNPGETGKIYIALDTNFTYRWSGSTYVEIVGTIGIWKGPYDNGETYEKDDRVSYNGSSYIATTGTTGNLPTDINFWDILALKGTDGTDGKTILNGVVNPTTEGVDGDFYLNTVTTELFGPKAGGSWPVNGVILEGTDGTDGRSVVSILLTDGDHSPGTIDTYTITYNIAPLTSTFTVYNGANGTGSVASVTGGNNITVDNTDGNNPIINLDDISDVIGGATNLHGLVTLGNIVELNTDITKLDIIAFDYFIMGTLYSYAGTTAISPTIGAGDSSTWVGADATGIVYSEDAFTDVQKLTILPLARLQAIQGQSGPGSELQPTLHLEYSIGRDGYVDGQWLLDVLGALYASGGTVSESSTALQVDQTSGVFYNSQRKKLNITGSSNIETSELYSVSGVPTLQTRTTLVIPKYWDNGTDRVILGNNKYASHTLLRSPKEDDVFILVYSDIEWNSQAEAEQAPIDYSIFVNQATSLFVPVARFILKGDSTNIIKVIDERPAIGATQTAIIGTATMQQVYDNSTSPEILTDVTRGALSVKRGSGADSDCIFEGLNGAGAQTTCIDGSGNATLNSVNGNTIGTGNTSGTNTGDQDLSGLEEKANKSINITTDTGSDIKYPSVKAVETYVQANAGGGSSTQSTITIGEDVSEGNTIAYVEGEILATILDSFASPSTSASGLAFDGTNLISCDYSTDLIYIHSGITSTTSSSFASPSTRPSGLTVANGNLISCDWEGDSIYIHSGITSTVSSSFASPSGLPIGLAFDGTNLLSCDQVTDLIYIHDGITSTILSSFASPAGDISGLAFDGTNLISIDKVTNLIYVHSGITSTIQYTVATGGVEGYGLTYTGNNLVEVSQSANTIYVHNENIAGYYKGSTTTSNFVGFATETVSSGNPLIIDTAGVNGNQTRLTLGAEYYLGEVGIKETIKESFANSSTGSISNYGVTFDGANLISINNDTDTVYIHDGISGIISSSFASPSAYPTGLAFDGTNLISCDADSDTIYIHSGITSTISSSFASPSTNPFGLTVVNGNLISSDLGDTIYIHDGISGIISSSFASPATNCSGLAFDGTNLISCDFGTDTIYIHDGVTSTILDSFSSPDIRPYGLTFTGTNLVSIDGESGLFYVHNGDIAGALATTGTTKVGKAISESEIEIFTGGVEEVVSEVSYPSNVYVSPTQTGVANTVFTFTHNLNFTQTDVEEGRYKVYLAATSGGRGRLYGDTFANDTVFGGLSSGVLYIMHDWTDSNPGSVWLINSQSNTTKILLGAGGADINPFRLIIQQTY